MARTDWAALLTDPAQEYLAYSELLRFGLDPYMPQIKKRHPARPGQHVMRSFPLFPRYLLIPINSCYDPAVRFSRGICRFKPVLSDAEGRPWRAPARIVEAVREAERRGTFDEILHKGDHITFAYGVLSTVRSVLSSDQTTGMIEMLMPLFGGVKATANATQMVQA